MAIQGVNGTAVMAAGAGALLVWSGIKGASVTTALREVLSGTKPSGAETATLTAATAPGGPVTASGGQPGSSGTSAHSPRANQALGRVMAAAYGWATGPQWTALNNLVMSESGWQDEIKNPSSTASGIAQNIAGFGPGYEAGNPRQQISWLLNYIRSRYGTPAAAWQFHLANNYY